MKVRQCCVLPKLSRDSSAACITNRKRKGERLSPCLTPTRLRNSCICLPDLNFIITGLYRWWMMLIRCSGKLNLSNIFICMPQFTVSNAFTRSTKTIQVLRLNSFLVCNAILSKKVAPRHPFSFKNPCCLSIPCCLRTDWH